MIAAMTVNPPNKMDRALQAKEITAEAVMPTDRVNKVDLVCDYTWPIPVGTPHPD